MKIKRILILGGTGFVGRHLVPILSAQGHQLTLLSRNREQHRDLELYVNTRVISANIYDIQTLERHMIGMDAVINLIGILNEPGFNGKGFFRAHVELTQKIILAMEKTGISRLIQISSLRAGEGTSYYLKSRGEAEHCIKKSRLSWSLLQASVIFGSGDGFFMRFAKLLRWIPIMPLACPKARFAPVFVGDVVRAIAQCLARDSTKGQTYELFGPERMSLRDAVTYTCEKLGLHRWVIPLPYVLGYLQAACLQWFPGKPISLDNWRSLQLDSIGKANGLLALDLSPTTIDSVMPYVFKNEMTKQKRLDRSRLQFRS
jgi:uncharacterized protein YbjT (DUF2867 family)